MMSQPTAQADTALDFDLTYDTDDADVLRPDTFHTKDEHVAALCGRVISLRRMVDYLEARAARTLAG